MAKKVIFGLLYFLFFVGTVACIVLACMVGPHWSEIQEIRAENVSVYENVNELNLESLEDL